MSLWSLKPGVAFLNHGAYGACPNAILEHQNALRVQLESEPVDFMLHVYPDAIQNTRVKLAAFIDATAEGLALTVNATAAFNAVLRSMRFEAGDKIVSTSLAYPAIANTLDYLAKRFDLNVSMVECRFDLPSTLMKQTMLLDIEKELKSGCRLLAVDHITSATAIRLPVEEIISLAHQYQTPVIIDGAHVPGMLPLSVKRLNPDFYIGNCHKWLCNPKGAGFLWVNETFRKDIVPTSISNGYSLSSSMRSRYQQLFDWTGTFDPSAQLTVPFALKYMASLKQGGWTDIMTENAVHCQQAARFMQSHLDLAIVDCDTALAMAALIIPKSRLKSSATLQTGNLQTVATALHPLQLALYSSHQVQVPIIERKDSLLLRISHQLYNQKEEYERLASALKIHLI